MIKEVFNAKKGIKDDTTVFTNMLVGEEATDAAVPQRLEAMKQRIANYE